MAYNINTEDTNGAEYPLLGAYMGSFDTLIQLKTNYPTGKESWFAFVAEYGTFVYWNETLSDWNQITGSGMPVFTASNLSSFNTIDYEGVFSIMGNTPGLFQCSVTDTTMYQMVMWKNEVLTRVIDLTANPVVYPEFESDTDKLELLKQEVENVKSGTNYIMVYGIGTPEENAAELQAAYNVAKTMPRYLGEINGDDNYTVYAGQTWFNADEAIYFIVNVGTIGNRNAITDNSTTIGREQAKSTRTTVVVAPGNYKYSDSFVFDTTGIYISSLTGNIDVFIDSSSEGTGITDGNIYFKGLSINNGAQTIIYDGKLYKVYSAIFNQFSSNAPTVTILENTIGNIIWTRNDTGNYSGTLVNAFSSGITMSPQNAINIINGSLDGCKLEVINANQDVISINTYDSTNIVSDGLLSDIFIEIRIYN